MRQNGECPHELPVKQLLSRTMVPSQDIGHKVHIIISQTNFAGHTDFNVALNTYSTSYEALSTDNTMVPNGITVGQELAGGIGASAPEAHFTNNQYEDTTGAFQPWTDFVFDGPNPGPVKIAKPAEWDFVTSCAC